MGNLTGPVRKPAADRRSLGDRESEGRAQDFDEFDCPKPMRYGKVYKQLAQAATMTTPFAELSSYLFDIDG